jgi:hypothetical protein
LGGVPLHPAVVHVPLGLAFLMPFLALAATVAWWKGWASKRTWAVVVVLQIVLLGAGLYVKQTGEHEVRRVRRILPRGAVRPHSRAADYFLWWTGATLVIAGLGLVLKDRGARWAATAATVAAFGTGAVAVRLGHLGGQLVYEKGAAMIYGADSSYALQRAAEAADSAAPAARPDSGQPRR